MKVERLYIVAIDNFSFVNPDSTYVRELRGGVEQLKARYETRIGAENVRLIEFRQSSLMGSPMLQGTPALLAESANTGMYIIAHSDGISGWTAGGFDAPALANAIKSLEIPSLRKACLIVCNAAKAGPVEGNPSFLAQFCAEMGIQDLKVAGWTGFVSVFSPDLSKSVGQTIYKEGSSKSKGPQNLAGDTDVGRKVIQYNSKFRLVSEGERWKQKRAYQFKDGQVYVANDTWHDV